MTAKYKEDQSAEWSTNFTAAGNALLPHTDGYMYGDHLPDVVFLLSEAPAEQGGETVILAADSAAGVI